MNLSLLTLAYFVRETLSSSETSTVAFDYYDLASRSHQERTTFPWSKLLLYLNLTQKLEEDVGKLSGTLQKLSASLDRFDNQTNIELDTSRRITYNLTTQEEKLNGIEKQLKDNRELLTAHEREVASGIFKIKAMINNGQGVSQVQVELTEGKGNFSGYVKVINSKGQFGFVCSDGWDDAEALVLCKQLGFKNGSATSAKRLSGSTVSQNETTMFAMTKFICSGHETDIFICPHSGWGNQSCSSKETAVVVCSPADDSQTSNFTLTLSSNSSYGYVKVAKSDSGVPGYVCGDSWDDIDATVVCKQLGFQQGFAKVGSSFGQLPNDSIFSLRDVHCFGKEASLSGCPHSEWGKHKCNASQAAGVICQAANQAFSVRAELQGVDGTSERHLLVTETMTNRTGYICTDEWDDQDALVYCKQLGFKFGTATTFLRSDRVLHQASLGLNYFQCTGKEASLLHCPYASIKSGECTTGKIAGVACQTTWITLTGGNNISSGNVYIQNIQANVSGYLCDDQWDDKDARVLCRQLGFNTGIARNGSFFGTKIRGTPKFPMGAINCTGHEAKLAACPHFNVTSNRCSVLTAAGVICQNSRSSVHLEGGNGFSEGHVVVTDITGRSGYVCDDSWDNNDASVVCRQLGFKYGIGKDSSPYGVLPRDNFAMDDVNCTGSESDILQCSYRGWGNEDCGTSEGAGVICISIDTYPVRLEGRHYPGNGYSSGHIIVYNGTGHSYVCHHNWDDQDATVVCRQRGFQKGRATRDSLFGPPQNGTFRATLDEVHCTGNETSILQCSGKWGTLGCTEAELAGVFCEEALNGNKLFL